jgi:hypothetical protein
MLPSCIDYLYLPNCLLPHFLFIPIWLAAVAHWLLPGQFPLPLPPKAIARKIHTPPPPISSRTNEGVGPYVQ